MPYRSYDRVLEESDATILSPKLGGLRREDVTRMRERGIPVIPWTVNNPEAIGKLIQWDVAGIITDYTDRALALRDGTRDASSASR